MSENKFKILGAVYVFIIKDNKILLLQRANTGFKDGWYSLPAGHLEANETLTEAAIRESREEICIDLKPEGLEAKVTMHRMDLTRDYIDVFFVVKDYAGEIKNGEPHKCSKLEFFDIDNLPEETIPYIKKAIECYQQGLTYTEWKE